MHLCFFCLFVFQPGEITLHNNLRLKVNVRRRVYFRCEGEADNFFSSVEKNWIMCNVPRPELLSVRTVDSV